MNFSRVVFACLVFNTTLAIAQQNSESWKFAVSGDSRNCGDVVMPAIAKSVRENGAAFYWHLGDFRAMYDVDEDIQDRFKEKPPLAEYQQLAWADFIENQIRYFDPVPVYLGIGNHETIGKTSADYLATFGYWIDTPSLRAQRISDNAIDPSLKTYYHWKQHNVDFIYLDNSGDDGFDLAQLNWFEQVLTKDKNDSAVRSVVVGMHRALPNSLACGHSMNGDVDKEHPASIESGRRTYADLVRWQKDAHKHVYVLASHSHFFMQDLYDTKYWNNPSHGGVVLDGWIVGTAGAKRYDLPAVPAELKDKTKAQTDVWGYLLGTVSPEGTISLEFQPVDDRQLPQNVKDQYSAKLMQECIKGNHDSSTHEPPKSCKQE
jgi:hypothetical protein